MSYLEDVGKVEGGGRWDAKNKNSSAQGKYQITKATFKLLQKKYPNEFGKISFEQMQESPSWQTAAAAYLTASNKEDLKKNGIENPSDLQLYAAHHLGSGRAAKLIKQGDDAKLSDYLSKEELEANPHLQGKTFGGFNQMFGGAFKGGASGAPGSGQLAGNASPASPAVPTAPTAPNPNAPNALPQANQVQIAKNNQANQMAAGGANQNYPSFSSFVPTANAIVDAQPKPQLSFKTFAPTAMALAGGQAGTDSIVNQIGKVHISANDNQVLAQDYAKRMVDKYSNKNRMMADTTIAPHKRGTDEHQAQMAQTQDGMVLAKAGGLLPGGDYQDDEHHHIVKMADGGSVKVPKEPAIKPWEIKWAQLDRVAGPSEDAPAVAPALASFAPVSTSPSNPWQQFSAAKKLVGAPDESAQDVPTASTSVSTAQAKPIDTPMNLAKRTLAGVAQGAIADPLVALAQISPSQTMRELAKKQVDYYEAARKGWGGEGFDASRLAGNVAGTAIPVLGLAGKAAKGAQLANAANVATKATVPARLASSIGTGLKGGAVGAALNPLDDANPEEYLDTVGKKIGQVGTGAVFGGALGTLAAPFAKKASEAHLPVDQAGRSELLDRFKNTLPNAFEDLSPYTKAGMTKAEQKLTSSALVGPLAEKSLQRQQWGFQRDIMNKALAPIGKEISPDKTGRGVIAQAKDELGKQYDDVLGQMKLPSTDLSQTIQSKMADKLDNLSPELRSEFDRQMNNGLFKHLKNKDGSAREITGKEWKELWSSHNKDDIAPLTTKGTVNDAKVGNLLKDAWNISKEQLSGSKELKKKLADTDAAYSNYKILSEASKQNAGGLGQFTATQALAQIKKRNPNQFETGSAFMQPELELAHRVMGDRLPNSGTAERLGLLPELGLIAGTGGFGAVPHAIAAAPYAARAIGEAMPKTFSAIGKGLSKTGKVLPSVKNTSLYGARAMTAPNGNSSQDLEDFEGGGAGDEEMVKIAGGGMVPEMVPGMMPSTVNPNPHYTDFNQLVRNEMLRGNKPMAPIRLGANSNARQVAMKIGGIVKEVKKFAQGGQVSKQARTPQAQFKSWDEFDRHLARGGWV